jgi:hypothetical protein
MIVPPGNAPSAHPRVRCVPVRGEFERSDPDRLIDFRWWRRAASNTGSPSQSQPTRIPPFPGGRMACRVEPWELHQLPLTRARPGPVREGRPPDGRTHYLNAITRTQRTANVPTAKMISATCESFNSLARTSASTGRIFPGSRARGRYR